MNLIEQMDKTTLQYRREHNIFEVGDKIVAKYHYGLLEVIEVRCGCVTVSKNSRVLFSKDRIQHATEEEIKAGKRL